MIDAKMLIELKEYIEKNLIVCPSRSIDFLIHNDVDSCHELHPDDYAYGETQTDDCICSEVPEMELEYFINNNRKPAFNALLFDYIDKKGFKDSYVYKKAGIDRRHFSKIRSNPNYKLSKNSVIALALALELDEKETDSFLSAAGYSLSNSNTFDLVIQFCITKKIYNINNVNLALDSFSLEPLI